MILSVERLSKSYHERPVVNLPKATFGKYAIEGLIGPNGAGKSTLMGMLTRRIEATSGEISFELDHSTHDLMPLRSHEVAQLGLIKTNQRIQGFNGLTIRDSLRLAATPVSRETLGSIFDSEQNTDEIEAEIDSYLDRFTFEEPTGFARSAGEKKLLDILRCLIAKPKMLLMDEPTAGLPEDVTQLVMQEITDQIKNTDIRVVIVEHDLELIWSFCEYVHFLSDGEMLFMGTPEDVKANRVVAEKYLGL